MKKKILVIIRRDAKNYDAQMFVRSSQENSKNSVIPTKNMWEEINVKSCHICFTRKQMHKNMLIGTKNSEKVAMLGLEFLFFFSFLLLWNHPRVFSKLFGPFYGIWAFKGGEKTHYKKGGVFFSLGFAYSGRSCYPGLVFHILQSSLKSFFTHRLIFH